MVDFQTLLQIAWTGLATATYGILLAAAFSLVLKVVKVWNFAQAGMMGIAFYVMYFVAQKLALPMGVAIACGLAVTIAAALAMERVQRVVEEGRPAVPEALVARPAQPPGPNPAWRHHQFGQRPFHLPAPLTPPEPGAPEGGSGEEAR